MGKIAAGSHSPRVLEAINRAIVLDEDNQTAAAVELLMPLVAEFPEAAIIHGYLASYLLTCRRFDESIAHARQAVRLSPRSEKASVVLLHVLRGTGRHGEARDEMKRFLAIRWSDEYARILKETGDAEPQQ
jgi:tetratricopeptide (TPR) repeat protein